jgi:hypothetical protein
MANNYIKTDKQKKIILGLEKAYEKLLESKRKSNSEIAIIKDGKIVKIKP